MGLVELIKAFGPPGMIGVLLGVAVVTWVRPGTAAGAALLIVVCLCLVMLAYAAFRLVLRLAGKEKADPQTGPSDE